MAAVEFVDPSLIDIKSNGLVLLAKLDGEWEADVA